MSENNNTTAPANGEACVVVEGVCTSHLGQVYKCRDWLLVQLVREQTKTEHAENQLKRFVGETETKWAHIQNRLDQFMNKGLINEGEDDLSDYLIDTFELSTIEEHEVTLTITYSGTIATKKGAELGDLCLEHEPSWSANVEIDGEIVGNLSLDGTDYDY